MTTGRGAWTKIGGTTPYYELHRPRVGSQALKDGNIDPYTETYAAVTYGVAAIQSRLIELGYDCDVTGKYTRNTKRAVKKFQEARGLVRDGVVGSQTCQALFRELIQDLASLKKVDPGMVYGIIYQESLFDPGAVGYSTPSDKGLAQFNCSEGNNTTWWKRQKDVFTVEDAFDYKWAITELVNRLAYSKRKFAGKGADLRNRCMIAQHNSPLWAQQWFESGQAPNTFIAGYVEKVLANGENF